MMATALGEHELIASLTKIFGGAAARRVASIGVGDDAAVLSAPFPGLVWTVDAAVEGVHFSRAHSSPEVIGARAFHAAASDIAAMGARPVAALSSLAAPRALSGDVLKRVARGQAGAARDLRCPVVGGNLSRAAELSITTTVIGVAARPLSRSGARAGDDVWLVGDVGLSHAGLIALRAKARRRPAGAARAIAACIRAFQEPRARIAEGLRLVGRASAAIDVSDGLGADAGHLAAKSRVRVVIEEAALGAALRPELVLAAPLLGIEALEAALSGGEDYALLATGAPGRRPRGAVRIGRVVKGAGVVVEDAGGRLRAAGSGYDHYRGR
jgi:thiamine-monophosphate kinase